MSKEKEKEKEKKTVVTDDTWPIEGKHIVVYWSEKFRAWFVPTRTVFAALGKDHVPDRYMSVVPSDILDERIRWVLNLEDLEACLEDCCPPSHAKNIDKMLAQFDGIMKGQPKKDKRMRSSDEEQQVKKPPLNFVLPNNNNNNNNKVIVTKPAASVVTYEGISALFDQKFNEDIRNIALHRFQNSEEFRDFKKRKCDEALPTIVAEFATRIRSELERNHGEAIRAEARRQLIEEAKEQLKQKGEVAKITEDLLLQEVRAATAEKVLSIPEVQQDQISNLIKNFKW